MTRTTTTPPPPPPPSGAPATATSAAVIAATFAIAALETAGLHAAATLARTLLTHGGTPDAPRHPH
jgi:hypothetical protein